MSECKATANVWVTISTQELSVTTPSKETHYI